MDILHYTPICIQEIRIFPCWHMEDNPSIIVPSFSWVTEIYNRTLHLLIYLTYLLTYSMVQSPYWEANWFAASQEIPRISRNLKVHYHTHKRPPPVSILGHPNPVHIHTSHLLEIHPNIIRPSTPRSPSGYPTKTLYTPISSPICATSPDHLILLSICWCFEGKAIFLHTYLLHCAESLLRS